MKRARRATLLPALLLASAAPADVAGAAAAAALPEIPATHAARMAAGAELFRTRVGDLLKENCLECHGGDKTKSGFSLASRPTLLRGGDQGVAVVPEQPAKSPLLAYLRHLEEPHMPPKRPMLAEGAIAAIERWIALGAPYDRPLVETGAAAAEAAPLEVTAADRGYWAYRRLAEAEPPVVGGPGWSAHPVDRFIAAAHRENGLVPSAPLDRARLARRLWFDLLGLPPPPDRVAAFVADPAPDDRAVAKLVDELLADEAFGERWARHWLDVARFAESHGFEHDYDRQHAYHYRDFVIRAFNADLPYDQFVRWQLAGDELAPENPLALMATGFLGAGVYPTQITISEAERVRYDALDDMLATVGSAFLATTVGCARCHDHKYDPIPTRDYYALLSAFTTTVRSDVKVDTWKLAPERAERYEKERAALLAQRAAYEEDALEKNAARWLESVRAGAAEAVAAPPPWEVLAPLALTSRGGATFAAQGDGSFLATGRNTKFDTYTFTAEVAAPPRALRVEALAHPSMVKGGPGRASNGNFALTDLRVTLAPGAGGGGGDRGDAPAVPLVLAAPRATFEQRNLPVAAAIDSDAKSCWAVDPQFGRDHAAVFEVANAAGLPAASGTLTLTLKFENNTGHNIGRLRVSTSRRPAASLPLQEGTGDPAEAARRRALALLAGGELTPGRRAELAAIYRPLDPGWQGFQTRLAELEKDRPAPETVMVCSEGSHIKPMRHHTSSGSIPDFYPVTHFLNRGDVRQKGPEATLGFLRVLTAERTGAGRWIEPSPAGARTSGRRSALARWIADTGEGAGHLLARVIVNRLWQHHTGRGLVATPNDFGFQGEEPTHPGLLDWLAGELVRSGWSLKHIHRTILLSRTYRMGDTPSAANARIDPDNRFLWRRPARRLEAEAIRDAALAASGVLDRTRYGPGTLDPQMRRRSIYFKVKRSRLVPVLQLFDWPDTLTSLGRRSVTTTPTQALVFINSPEVRGWAEAFAASLEGAADPVADAYRRALGRTPTGAERDRADAFIAAQTAAREGDRRAARADFCQALMGSNEFVYVE